jgi:chromosome segregation ATPase
MSQLQQTMATLRMSLAEIQHKENQLDSLVAQFRTQLRRLPRQVIYGKTSLEMSLAAMGEIEERLADAVATRRRLLAIKKSAMEELEALELLKRVDEARRSLQALKQRIRTSGEDEETLAEIRRLEQFIADYSKRAEWAITTSYQERQEK